MTWIQKLGDLDSKPTAVAGTDLLYIVQPPLSDWKITAADIATYAGSVFTAAGTYISTASNVGAGETLFKQKTATDLEFKTLVAGSNITLTPGANSVTIAASGGGGGAWGSITGTLSDQTDLQSALDAKSPTTHDHSVTGSTTNTKIGLNALSGLTSGTSNTASGLNAGNGITSGLRNTVYGASSGSTIGGGNDNVVIGYSANTRATATKCVVIGNSLGNDAAQEVVAIGYGAGGNTGSIKTSSVFIGMLAGSAGSIVGDIVAIGHSALSNTLGTTVGNTLAIGSSALVGATISSGSTSVGNGSGSGFGSYSNCTFLGYLADSDASGYSNAMALGYNAKTDASNHVRIGDTNITQIGGQVAWSNLSDKRIKKEIKDMQLGIDFIKELRPVSYKMISETDTKEHWGLIAQDVKELVGSNKGVLEVPEKEETMMSIAYTELLAPMIKAIQEQQERIEQLELQIKELKKV